MENDALIELRDVTKRFNGRTILDRVNLKIYQGQVTTIIGKSGMGKSVLLKHIIALIKPDEGSILFKDRDISSLAAHLRGEADVSAFRQCSCGQGFLVVRSFGLDRIDKDIRIEKYPVIWHEDHLDSNVFRR